MLSFYKFYQMIISYSNNSSFFQMSLVVACLLAQCWTNESRLASAQENVQETTQASSTDDDIVRREYLQYALTNDGNIERGKSLFNNKERAQCDKCHMINGIKKSGPHLDGIADKYLPEELLRQCSIPANRSHADSNK